MNIKTNIQKPEFAHAEPVLSPFIATSIVDQTALASMVATFYTHRKSLESVTIESFTATIAAIATTLLDGKAATSEPAVSAQKPPAVKVSKSVQDDHIVCLEDGLKFKSLKRHLTRLGMTPEEYRKKWNLPSDYPMVAPNYAKARSSLAKQMGLGKNRAIHR